MLRLSEEIRRAARALTRSPGFALAATATLALGIGLSTAVFTIADGVLLRRLPVADQDRVVTLWGETRDGRFANVPVALKEIQQFQRTTRSLDGIAYHAFRGATPTPIRNGDQIGTIRSSMVSGNLFDVMGARAALGRPLRAEDDVAGAAPVTVISHRAWQNQFGGDSSVIGRSITMFYSGTAYRIVGVMPQGLEYPSGTEAWVPVIAYSTAGGFAEIATGELDMVARLRSGASASAARTELTNFVQQTEMGRHRDVRGVVHPLADVVFGDAKPAILLVMIAAALLLAITCVNVTNLLLVRAVSRVRELVVRAALGADRRQLVMQSLMETGLLAIAGGVLGVLLAVVVVRAFVAIAPESLPRADGIAVNGNAMLAAIAATTLAMLASSVWPSLFAFRADAQDALRSGTRHTGTRRVTRTAELLVGAQIALAALSLASAGLVTRSFIKLQSANLSFDPNDLVVATLGTGPGASAQDSPTRGRDALFRIIRNIAAIPGVQGVSPVFAVPFTAGGGGIDGGPLSTADQTPANAARNPILNLELAASNYFVMLGIPVIKGRAFTDADREGSTPVVVVSASVAKHYWGDGDPIGKILMSGRDAYRVVGVVPDTRYRDLEHPRLTVYYPISQNAFGGLVPQNLVIRVSSSPGTAEALRAAVAQADPRTSILSLTSLQSLLEGPRARPRMNAVVLAFFATAAALLAALGLFAIIATMVRHRTRELGIRMALGATPSEVCRLVMGRGVAIAGVGAAIGIAATFAIEGLLSSLMFEMSPTDPLTLAAVMLGLFATAALATFLPARTSMRIDPMIALRTD